MSRRERAQWIKHEAGSSVDATLRRHTHEDNGGDGVRQGAEGVAFEVEIPLMKAWEDSSGGLWFEGVASSTAVDRQKERMSREAIEKMARSGEVDLLPSHDAGPLEELGVVEECWADNDQFRVRGKFDKTNPRARVLFERCKAGKPYGLSVGGRVIAAHWQFDDDVEDTIRVIEDVELDHIAICRPTQAVNPETYLGVMAKAAEAIVSCDSESDEGEEDGPSHGELASLADDAEASGGSERPGAVERMAKIGRFVVDLSKSLWGGDEREAAETDAAVGSPQAWAEIAHEVSDLRKQLTQAMDDLACVVKAETSSGTQGDLAAGAGVVPDAARCGDNPDVTERANEGKTSLDGQERIGGHRAHFWKGVL
jgi:hypothetical protein